MDRPSYGYRTLGLLSPRHLEGLASYSAGTLRLVSTLTPSLFNSHSWWNRSLHRSQIGMRLLTKSWNGLDRKVLADGDFDGRGEVAMKNGFEKLKPHLPIIWQNQEAGFINRPDFWHAIAMNVQVIHEDVDGLEKGLIRLKDGLEIPADAILCGTGWVSSLNFFDHDQLAKFGLPQPIGTYPAEEAAMWRALEQDADRVVLDRFPILANAPKHYREPVTHTPYRLYNSIAPLQDDPIVFAGHVMIASYFHLAECQAIWATAYLDGNIKLPPLEERRKTVALFVAWCRRRYLSNGDRGHWLAFEQRTYTDRLFDQLGLSSHRRFWLWDSFVPISKKDLPRLRAEYINEYGQDAQPLAHEGTLLKNVTGSAGRRPGWDWRRWIHTSPQLRRTEGRNSFRSIHVFRIFSRRSMSTLPPYNDARLPKHVATLFRSIALFAMFAR